MDVPNSLASSYVFTAKSSVPSASATAQVPVATDSAFFPALRGSGTVCIPGCGILNAADRCGLGADAPRRPPVPFPIARRYQFRACGRTSVSAGIAESNDREFAAAKIPSMGRHLTKGLESSIGCQPPLG